MRWAVVGSQHLCILLILRIWLHTTFMFLCIESLISRFYKKQKMSKKQKIENLQKNLVPVCLNIFNFYAKINVIDMILDYFRSLYLVIELIFLHFGFQLGSYFRSTIFFSFRYNSMKINLSGLIQLVSWFQIEFLDLDQV